MCTERGAATVACTTADTPCRGLEATRWVEIRDAGNVVRLQHAVGNRAVAERDREHHCTGSHHAAGAVGPKLRFAERRMAQPDEMADFVDGNRLEIEAAWITSWPGRPVERGIEEDIRLDQLAGLLVIEKVRRAEHALLLRVALEADHRQAIFVGWIGQGKPAKLKGN